MISHLLDDLNEDPDLLIRSDRWLGEEYTRIAHAMDHLANDLKNIRTAQMIKAQLKQRNLVPVQQLIKDQNGNPVKAIITIEKPEEALRKLACESSPIDGLNLESQLSGWIQDGVLS